jgi:RNA polymerase sigma-70 factor, ECF subfamily
VQLSIRRLTPTKKRKYEEAYNNQENHYIVQKVFKKYIDKGLSSDSYQDILTESLKQCVNGYRKSKKDKKNKKSKFTTYLYRITTCRCIDELRKKDKSGKMEYLDDNLQYSASKEAVMVGDCLEAIPDIYRQILQMRYFDNMSLVEISEALEENETCVNILLKEAEEMLREEVLDYIN